jgi:hypothetical protein
LSAKRRLALSRSFSLALLTSFGIRDFSAFHRLTRTIKNANIAPSTPIDHVCSAFTLLDHRQRIAFRLINFAPTKEKADKMATLF